MICLSETDLRLCAPVESRRRAEYSDRQERQKGKEYDTESSFSG